MENRTVVSGIQPTGRLHLGNYLGSLRNFAALQHQHPCYFFIADYHSLTEDYNPQEKPRQILSLAADFLAAGLDPKRCTIFVQSDVPEHTELAWVLSCVTPVGQLKRMTQFKDKAARQRDNVNAGLFTYPVLQAADILIYQAAAVPVGGDQLQHLELSREIARCFNKRYGQTFPEPQPLLTVTPVIRSVKDPTKKMSKSLGDGHCIYLDDEPAAIARKLKSAPSATGTEPFLGELAAAVRQEASSPATPRTTSASGGGASDDPLVERLLLKHRGADRTVVCAVRNLLTLAAVFIGPDRPITEFRFAALKQQIAEAIADHLKPYRERRAQLLADPTAVLQVLAEGARRAQAVAQRTMAEVRERVGLRYRPAAR